MENAFMIFAEASKKFLNTGTWQLAVKNLADNTIADKDFMKKAANYFGEASSFNEKVDKYFQFLKDVINQMEIYKELFARGNSIYINTINKYQKLIHIYDANPNKFHHAFGWKDLVIALLVPGGLVYVIYKWIKYKK